MEIILNTISKIIDLFFKMGIAGIVLIGFLSFCLGALFLWNWIRFIIRARGVIKGQIYVIKAYCKNPFKETKYQYAEIVDRKKGFVEYIVEGDTRSNTTKAFLDLYNKSPHEYKAE